MMPSLTLPAYAKINLHLEITGIRANGYHEVESLMQSLTLADTLKLTLTDGEVSMTCSDPSLSCGEDNLVMKAARAFYRQSAIEGGVTVRLEKRIPSQAGMGGGSSDAAATLRGLNELYGYPLTAEELHNIAAKLGADVPFCLGIRPAIATGIGTDLTPAAALPDCILLLAIGNSDKMSTREAYAALDAAPFTPRSMEGLLDAIPAASVQAIAPHLFNRFTVLNPTSVSGMARMQALGAIATLLCGSGAAFFGIFERMETAESASETLQKEGYRTWIAHPIC